MLAIALLGSGSTIGMAADSTEAQPKTTPCTNCATGEVAEDEAQGQWYNTKISLTCAHRYPKGVDRFHQRTVYVQYSCNNCDFSEQGAQIRVEERMFCYGYGTEG